MRSILVDAAQAISHIQIRFAGIRCGFYAFSAHKIYGPNGIGILSGKLSSTFSATTAFTVEK